MNDQPTTKALGLEPANGSNASAGDPAYQRRRQLIINALLLLVTSLFALLTAEVAVRVYLAGKRNDLDSLRQYQDSRPEIPTGQQMALADTVEIWGNDLRVYRLRPNLQGQFIGQPLYINEDGYRGPRLSPSKAPGVFRIVGVGDSVMFGWGAPFEQTYLYLLVDFLNSRRPAGSSTTYEFANLGTPGYNAIMESELLREAGLPLQPDLVVLGFVENDAMIPNFIRKRENYWAVNRLFLLELIQANWEASQKAGLGDGGFSPPGLEHAFNRERVDWELEDNNWKVKWMKVPPEYEYLHGWDKVEKGFGAMQRMAKEHGFKIVMLTDQFSLDKYLAGEVKTPDQDIARGIELGLEHGFAIADPLPPIERFVSESGRSSREALWLTEQDSHPNLSRQYLLTAALYQALVQNDLIPDAAARQETLIADLEWLYEQAVKVMPKAGAESVK